MSTRFANEITISAGTDFDLGGGTISGYSPSADDVIILTPVGKDSADADASDDVPEGNIKSYLHWDTVNGTWKVKVSDSSFSGKILVAIIKT